MPVGKLDQAGGHALGFFSDWAHTNLLNDLKPGFSGIKAGNIGGAVHEAHWRISVADGARREGERVLVREPAGERGLEFFPEVRTHVKISRAGAAAEPLQHAPAGEIH